MKTTHQIIYGNAGDMGALASESVDLAVTSPPYPMIEMWDRLFMDQDARIRAALKRNDSMAAFSLMHDLLAPVWEELWRVLKPGRFACINIGDATRTVNEDFCLYPNHMKILDAFIRLGFTPLPDILWRKQTNAPNKFMGSGMLPAGAYVTFEHEYILIFRKGPKRLFKTDAEKENRHESALFWEERNIWFSDVWTDVKGAVQSLKAHKEMRKRSAAFPFEVAYRLINMYSVKGDVVLDPFLGAGTTMAAAAVAGRNSVGCEIEHQLRPTIEGVVRSAASFGGAWVEDRLRRHVDFVQARERDGKPVKYVNEHHGFPVVTRQEKKLLLNEITQMASVGGDKFEAAYADRVRRDFSGDRPPETKTERPRKSPRAGGRQLSLFDG